MDSFSDVRIVARNALCVCLGLPDDFGPYCTPQFHYGEIVEDEVRGQVRIVGITDGPIPWPIGLQGRAKSAVIYGDLATAIRLESAPTVRAELNA